MHASNDLEAIYRGLERKVDSIKKELLSLTEDIEGAEFYGARIKARARALEKLEYRTADEIGDILGARIVADSDAAIDVVVDGLRQRGATLLDIDDFRERPRGAGGQPLDRQRIPRFKYAVMR